MFFLFHLGFAVQQRYVLAFMAFLALFNAFAMRANLTIAITRMTMPANITEFDKNVSTIIIDADSSFCPIDPDDDGISETMNQTDDINANIDMNIIIVCIEFHTLSFILLNF